MTQDVCSEPSFAHAVVDCAPALSP